MAVEVRDNRESPRISMGWVLSLVGGFILMVAIAMFGLHHFYRAMLASGEMKETFNHFPIPQLQPNPAGDLARFRVEQNQELAGYAWVDKGKGLVHIPIAQAMQLVVSRGAAALDPPDQIPGTPNEVATGTPPDGAPRAPASMPASPYGAHP